MDEAAEDEAATEDADASARPGEAEDQEAFVEPPLEGEASTRGAIEPEAATSAANTEGVETAPGGQDEEATPEPMGAGVEDEKAPSP